MSRESLKMQNLLLTKGRFITGGNINMNREELIQLVNKIMNCEGSEKEIDDMIHLLEKM